MINQMNNSMNPMNDLFNKMNNPMNQMNLMNNQMNLMNNQMQMNPKMNQLLPMGNVLQKKSENLIINFQMENSIKVNVQCKSDEKMEKVINKFCTKAGCEKDTYAFFIKKKTIIIQQ